MKPGNLGLGRMLVPSTSPVQFEKRRQVRRLVERTERIVASLRGSLLGDWEKLRPLLNAGPAVIQPVHAAE